VAGLVKILFAVVVFLGYPYLVYRGISLGLGWLVPIAMAAVFLYRAYVSENAVVRYRSLALAALLILGSVYLHSLMVKLIPVGINLGMLYFFGKTLIRGPSLIEHFARLDFPDFKPGIAEYCRQVTIAWVVFFAINVVVVSGLALWASNEIWAFYNSVIFFIMMGLLFVAEYIIRHIRLTYIDIPSPMDSIKSIVRNGPKVWRDVLTQ